ncbi:MAG: flagellar biosynthetic protein FliO [Acetobacteraceae bacterium]|nr:flagellar biosynthetic protein FliO [Acetobacteraceae bacterium]
MTLDILIPAPGALALVLALVLLAQRAARWGGLVPRPGGGGRLAMVEFVALDPRRRLCLLRCDGRHVLVLTGGAQDLVVGWVDPPAPQEGA